jgi:hypothetical protein
MIQSDTSSIQNNDHAAEEEHGERNNHSELFHNNFPMSCLSLSSAQRPLSDAPSDVDAQPSESNIENDEENLHANDSADILNAPISIALPRQTEPASARIQMIERERQARLERERAKIKRHFVLNREREAEDQAFEEADIARIGSEDHLSDSIYSIGEMIVGSDHDEPMLPITTNGHDGNHHNNHNGSMDEHIAPDGNNLNINVASVNRTLSDDDQQQQQQQQPLGYTMELFLKERNPSQHSIHEENTSNNSVPQELHSNEEEHDISHDIHDPVMRSIEHDLRSQIVLASNHIVDNFAAVSNMSVISHDNMSLEANRPSSDISSPTRYRSDSHDLEINPIARDFLENHPASTNYPRLERLTEAEIFDIHDIDYASVGNMPPRSVRDERHLPEVVAGMSNFSNATQTTLLDSESSVHSTSSSHVETHKLESSILHSVHDDGEGPTHSVALGVASLPTNNALSPISSTSILDHQNNPHQSDSSVVQSDSSDRKPPALLLKTENDIDSSFEYDATSIEDTKVITTHPTNTEHFQNRTIRPGIGDSQLRTKRSNYAHRRAQTTPNFQSFVDDFDYCKYNDDSIQSGLIAAKSMQNLRDDVSPDNYGSVGEASHWNRDINIVDKEPLLNRDNIKNQRSYDDMVDSVFSSVRSVSTEDIQAEIDECEAYASSNVVRRGKSFICKNCCILTIC